MIIPSQFLHGHPIPIEMPLQKEEKGEEINGIIDVIRKVLPCGGCQHQSMILLHITAYLTAFQRSTCSKLVLLAGATESEVVMLIHNG